MARIEPHWAFFFVLGPFLLEGSLQGVVGGLLAPARSGSVSRLRVFAVLATLSVLPDLDEMLDGGIITFEKVHVFRYRAKRD